MDVLQLSICLRTCGDTCAIFAHGAHINGVGWTCKWIWKCVYKCAIFEYGANRNTTSMDMFKLQLNHMQKNRHTEAYKFR
jgi:hypothetical protein